MVVVLEDLCCEWLDVFFVGMEFVVKFVVNVIKSGKVGVMVIFLII